MLAASVSRLFVLRVGHGAITHACCEFNLPASSFLSSNERIESQVVDHGANVDWNPASNSEGGKGFFAGEVQRRGGPVWAANPVR